MSGGQITGVVINHLSVLAPQTELEVLLRAPLATLPAPERPLLIVIDSLDEAATLRSDPTLVTLLAGVDRLPGWLRIFCTSRGYLDYVCDGQAPAMKICGLMFIPHAAGSAGTWLLTRPSSHDIVIPISNSN